MARRVTDKIFICGKCGKRKRKSSFYKEASRAHGISSRCIRCDRKKNKAEYYRDSDKRKAYRIRYKDRRRELHLEQKWGLSHGEYDSKLKKQGGVCAICQQPPVKRSLAVDHCHLTNKIRDLLCDSCNLGIGYFNDDPELMMLAAIYIQDHLK